MVGKCSDSLSCESLWEVCGFQSGSVKKTLENKVWELIDREVSRIKEGMPTSKKIIEVRGLCGHTYFTI